MNESRQRVVCVTSEEWDVPAGWRVIMMHTNATEVTSRCWVVLEETKELEGGPYRDA